MLDGADVICIAATSAGRVVSSTLQPGTRVPAYCTANGRVLLSALPQAEVDAWIAARRWRRSTPSTITNPERLRLRDRTCRVRRAMRTVDQEFELGLRTIRVPLKSYRGDVLAAMNVSVHAARVSMDQLVDDCLPALLHAQASLRTVLAAAPRCGRRSRSSAPGRRACCSQLLQRPGIDSVVLERRSRDYVLGRVRAGVIEQGTVEILPMAGVASAWSARASCTAASKSSSARHATASTSRAGARDAHRLRADGAHERSHGRARGGRRIGRCSRWRTSAIEGLEGNRPTRALSPRRPQHALECDFVAGCDGFHGVSRRRFRRTLLQTHRACLPVRLARRAGRVAAGVAGADLRESRARLRAVQHALDRRAAATTCNARSTTRVEDWTDERFWDELRAAAAGRAGRRRRRRRRRIEKSVAPLRSFVAEPLRYGRLFLAGDAAHIVPPTGAKGLNLAARDVSYLAEALVAASIADSDAGIDAYSQRCLRASGRRSASRGG